MKKAWYIIANPRAGRGSVVKCLDELSAMLSDAKIEYVLQFSEGPNHAIALVRDAIDEGYRKIIGVGGDGTNNEMVNGILQQKIVPGTDILYTLLPCGTGNDWVKTYRIPREVHRWIKMLQTSNSTLQDVGWLRYRSDGKTKERYFANVAGMSYDAFVVREMAGLKRPITNRIGYLIYGLYYVFRYRIPAAKIWLDGKARSGKYYLINAGICRYSGGGMQLVPHAIPDDGKLAVTLAGSLSKLGVILNSHRFYNGKIAGHSKVHTFQIKQLRVEHVEKPILVEVDGEFLGTTPVEIRIVPDAIRVLIP